MAVAEREDGVARVEGRDGHAKAKSVVAAVIAAGMAYREVSYLGGRRLGGGGEERRKQ